MTTLKDRFDPRANSIDLLRVAFALLVAVAHGMVMHRGSQPLFGGSELGDFGVDGFFILSGLLVTRSYLNLDSFSRYAWHRFLRIMPGFWVCLVVVGLALAPLAAVIEGRSPASALTVAPPALRYVFGNATLYITQYDIAGLLANNPTPGAFNGSLWTLLFEAFCYLLIAALGGAGLLRRGPVIVPAITVLLWVLLVLQSFGVETVVGDLLVRMTFLFFLGATAYLYADRIPMTGWLAAVAFGIFLLSVGSLENYRLTGAAPFAYAIVWFAACFPHPVRLRADLSYGLYIYHWPILQLLALTTAAQLPTPGFVVVGLLLAAAAATASWYWVEKPALARKNSPLPQRVEDAVTSLWSDARQRVAAR